MSSIIRLNNISKTFTDHPPQRLTVLKNINLEIEENEIFVILGPSGSGKSTLLRLMSRLEKDFEGTLEWARGLRPFDISFVFQQFALLPWLSAYQNIELPLIARRLPPTARKEKTENILKLMGLQKFSQAYPRELSGGMRQRVGIARALVTDPKIIFMDEPFSELDTFTAAELRQDLIKIWQARRLTIVLVTHNVEEALELGSRIAILTPPPAKIEKIIDNALPRPRNKRSPTFFALEDKIYQLIRP